MSQQHTITGLGKNTRVARDNQGVTITLYSTPIVHVSHLGVVTLNSGGHRTTTTKTRMNQASNQLGLGFRVYQTGLGWNDVPEWWVSHAACDRVPFIDGMGFPTS